MKFIRHLLSVFAGMGFFIAIIFGVILLVNLFFLHNPKIYENLKDNHLELIGVYFFVSLIIGIFTFKD